MSRRLLAVMFLVVCASVAMAEESPLYVGTTPPGDALIVGSINKSFFGGSPCREVWGKRSLQEPDTYEVVVFFLYTKLMDYNPRTMPPAGFEVMKLCKFEGNRWALISGPKAVTPINAQ